MHIFVNCISQEGKREESLEAWKGEPVHSTYWRFFMEHMEPSFVQSYTKMLLRCAPLSDCRELFEQALNHSLHALLQENDYQRIVAEIIPLPLSLMADNIDSDVLHGVVDGISFLSTSSYYDPFPSFLSFCETLTLAYYQDLSTLFIKLFHLCEQEGIPVKVSRRMKAKLKRIAQRIRNKEELVPEEKQFIDLFEWTVSHSSKRKLPTRLYNRNPVINDLLKEEAGSDNYDDLADFIDPSPDLSIQEIQRYLK